MPVKILIFLLVASLLSGSEIQQDDSIAVGCDMRLLNSATRGNILKVINYRVSSGQAVEPMLIFSPYSDPDILGSIAVDNTLSLEVREIAANALLDQLFEANGYFQVCTEYYLKILINSDEKVLRYKGWIGEAVMEYWRFYSGTDARGATRMLRLKYSASRERDPSLRRELDLLSKMDPTELLGSAAWSPEISAAAVYRKLDKTPHPAPRKLEGSARGIAAQWRIFTDSLSLSKQITIEGLSGEKVAARIKALLARLKKMKDNQLTGFLARVNAFGDLEESEYLFPQEFISFFKRLAQRKSDPYLRSLALKPASFGNKFKAKDFLLEVLAQDQSALVRLSAAELLKSFSDNPGVRTKMMNIFRTEEDYRVRLRILHSLVKPFISNLPRDVVTFLMNRLKENQEEIVMEYLVFVLGNAKVRAAYGSFSSLLANSRSVILRARIAESLAKMGLGTRRRTLESSR